MLNAIFIILFIVLILIICFIISEALHSSYSEKNRQCRKFNNYNGGNLEENTIMSYTISGEDNGLDFSQLRQALKDINLITFVEKPVTEKVHVSFGTFGNFMIKGKIQRWNYDPLFFKQNTAIKNTLGEHHNIINKSELYNTIKKLIPNGIKHLPKSYTSNVFENMINNNVNIHFPLILKKDKIPLQQAIRILLSKEDYYKAIKDLNIKNDAIISEYISNPLLLDGKKMHFRVYYLLSIISGIVRCTVHDEYRIHLANDLYKKEDWLNPDIHISGAIGKSKNRPYYWPDDVSVQYDINLIKEKMAEFNKVICMAMTIANAKNYSESYAGYHVYGADVMLTDDFQVYLLEINDRPGFNFSQNEKEASKKFSYKLFSFILNSTVLPFFGLKRPPSIYEGEFIDNGALTQFAEILIGANKCYFIPYLNATQKEIEMVKNIYFFKHSILFNNLIKNVNPNDIFLIAYMTNLVSVIIGYVVLNKDNFLQIAITKEYQNRGIATAMVAQLIEIYFARHIMQKHFIIFINSGSNDFINNIAKKLKFIINKNNIYEKDCKLHNNNIIHKILKYKLLTYKIVSDENNKINFYLNNIFIWSGAQFVHFSYNMLLASRYKKYSTGSKYDYNFIYQGAELKSALNIKILFGVYTFKRWYYSKFNDDISYIFGRKKINAINEFKNNKKYSIYDYNINKMHLIDNINNDHFSENHLIEEYDIPYLIDNKLICVRSYLIIYISGDIIKIFCFDQHFNFSANEKLSTDDLNNSDKIYVNSKNLVKITDDKILKHMNNLVDLLQSFFKKLLLYDIKPYPESNSGFYEFCIDIKFIKNDDTYTPTIHQFYNWGLDMMPYEFIDKYYQWLSNCIVLPHFGCQSLEALKFGGNQYTPIYGISNFAKIKYETIKDIFLEFNKDRTYIKIYYKYLHIGHIKLNIKMINNIIMDHIEIDTNHRKKNISIHVIYNLMNLLGAYYAPHKIVLSFLYIKQMHAIAFELNFLKHENLYTRACR